MDFRVIVLFLMTVIFLGLWLLVLLKGPRQTSNRVYSIFVINMALWSLGLGMFYLSPGVKAGLFWTNVLYLAGSLIPAAFLHFSFVFPFGKMSISRFKQFLIYVPNILLFYLFFFTPIIVKGITPPGLLKGFIYGPGHIIWDLQFNVIFIWGFVRFFMAYRRGTGTIKARLRYIILGTLIGVILAGITNVLMPWFNRFELLWLGPLLALTWLVCIAYAIVKYRLMDINIVITKGVTYAALLILTAGLTFGLMSGYSKVSLGFIDCRIILPYFLLSLLVLTALIFFLPGIKPKTEKAIEVALFKNKYEYRDVLREFSGRLSFILKQEELLDLTVKKVAATMGVAKVVVMLQDEITGNYTPWGQMGLDEAKAKELSLAGDKGVVAWVAKNKTTLINEEVERILSVSDMEEINRDLNALESSVCVPLMIKDKLIGLLAISDRPSGEMFPHLDIKLLESLADQLALAIGHKKLEAQIAHNENLMQLGILSGSMAHQIRNPLSSISTFAQLLHERYGDQEFRNEFSEVVNRDVQRIIQIIDSIMDLATTKEPEFQPLDIHELIDESLILIDTKLKTSGIEVKKSYASLPKVKGDRVLLRQVFLNIFLNAIQAMDKTEKGNRIEVSTALNNDRVRIKIEDNGLGIKKRLLSKLFEPFTTTKDTGEYRGMGLGLSIVQRIIDQHGGRIKAESKLGEWTRFWIELLVEKKGK